MFNRNIFIVLSLIGISLTATGAPRGEVGPSQLPPGKTKEQVSAMLREIDRKTANEYAQEVAAMQRQDERLRRAMKKYEDRIAKAVESDPELRALRDKLETGGRAFNNTQMSEEERKARFERMAPDMRTLRQKALAKAGIDERAMNSEILREVNSGVTTRGADEGESSDELLAEEDGVFYFITPDDEEPPPVSEVTTRGTSTVNLGDPWPWTHEGNGVYCGAGNGVIHKNNGAYKVQACGVGASGQNYRGLAHYRTVRSGDKKYRVSAQLPETSWGNRAIAGIIGGARSKTWSKIEVWDGSAKRLCRAVKVHANLVATWGQSLNRNGKDTTALACEFTAPPANHEVVIRFISGAYVSGGAINGSTYGSVIAQPRNVTLYVTR